MENENSNIHFVLVHGSCHGAWCWYKLATLLKSGGYKVSIPDLRASGLDPTRVEDLKSISEYSEPLTELLSSLPQEEKVILVGHSMGGPVISLASERFHEKISVAIYATAFMAGPDITIFHLLNEYLRRLDTQMDNEFFFHNGPNNPPTSFIFGKEFLATKLYQLCPPEVLTLATMLVRPSFSIGNENFFKDVVTSKDKYGSVPRVYIVCDQDMALNEDFQRYVIENNRADEVVEIKGSDHMVMLSKPDDLYACLQGVARSHS